MGGTNEEIIDSQIQQKQNTMEPVLNEKGKPCFLSIKEVIKPGDANKPIKKVLKENKQLEYIKTFELKKERLWICNRCNAEIQSNPDRPTYCEACKRNSKFTKITEYINPDLWKLPIWKDISVDELDMIGLYDDMVNLIKKLVVFSEELEYKIYVLWIISTWKLECWDAVGFPVFIGIPNSGKSRALRIIHNLAYRAPKASGIKAAAIPRLCHYYNITLLIDEAHSKMNPKYEQGSQLLDFVKDSYKRDSVYITCDNNDQEKVVVAKNFGFKAFAGEKTFNPGLLSRSLVFWMDKADPEISKLAYVEEEFNNFRTRLLNYRCKTNDPEDLGNDFCLKGRTREIFESIIATGKHIGIDVEDIIEYGKRRDKEEEEALKSSVQWEILSIIKNCQENPTLIDAPSKISTEDILEQLGWTSNDGKENRKHKQRLGYTLNDMGLQTRRIREGRFLFIEDKSNKSRLENLYKRYKL